MTNGASNSGALNPALSATNNEPQSYLFLSRVADFWFIGGLSIALWIPVYFLQDQFSLINSVSIGLPGLAFTLAYWVNYPHFMASYKLAYTQGNGFIQQNWFQLILVPFILVAAILIGFFFWNANISNSALVQSANTLFAGLGLNTRIGLYPNLGSEILGSLVLLLYFTVGWHYAKQTFGCMMVYAKLDNYRLTNLERNTIRYALLSTWWVSWLYSNCSVGTYNFYDLKIHRLGLPPLLFDMAYVITTVLFVGVAFTLLRKYLRDRQMPSWNFLIPMLALLIWHIPLFGNPQYFYLLALFHSLQYFPFVAKVEKTRYRKDHRARPQIRLLLFFIIMMTAGYLSFDWIPNGLDQAVNTKGLFHTSFFIISFLAFINVHHYFIDNVLWRFKNKEVKQLLLD
jgi:hypothetical protein